MKREPEMIPMSTRTTSIPSGRPGPSAGLAASLLAIALAGCDAGGATDGNDGTAAVGRPVPAVAKAVDGSVHGAPAEKGPAREPAPSLGEGAWGPVERGAVTAFHPAPGILRARQTTRLGSQVNGRVREVLVDVGDRVKAGQELLRLDPAFFEIEVALRKADVEAARVMKADAELNFGRMKNLWEKPDGKDPSVPRKLFDDARARLETASAGEKQALEALANAEERRKESVIRAPYDGVIARRMVDAGEPVTSAP